MMKLYLLLGVIFFTGASGGALFKERAVESRMDLPCCQDDHLLSCHQVDLDVNTLGDQDLELAPLNTTVQYKGLVQGSKNSYHYENDLVDLVLTVHNGDIYGHMAMDNGDSYTVEYCGDGVHVMKQLDVENLGENIGDDDEEGEMSSGFLRAISTTEEGEGDRMDIVEYSIKVYYTPQFAAVTADIEGFVEQVIQETNQGYYNSRVPLKAKVLCIEEATIDDMPSSKEQLSAFKYMKASVSELRGTADVAVLLVKSLNKSSCGRGYINSIRSGNTLSVATKNCALGYYTFGHEVGHNIGLMHNKEKSSNPYYEDGHGYLISKGSHYMGYRTILAYSASGHGRRVNYYSNPDVIYPKTGTPTGKVGVANNAKILTNNRFALAAVGDESESCNAAPDECFLEDVSLRESKEIIVYNSGKYSQAMCLSACVADSNCYEYMSRTTGACAIRKMYFAAGGGYTMPDIMNQKCLLKKECGIMEFPYFGFYTMRTLTTADAKECHKSCANADDCKFWIWKNRTCEFKADIYNYKSSYFFFGTRFC